MSRVLSAAEVFALAVAAGCTKDQAVTATAIAGAESGYDADAIGDVGLEDATWGPSVGLWQIRSLKAQQGTGGDRDESRLKDPAANARSMYAISGHGTTWHAWTTYTRGTYKAHLAEAQAAAAAAPANLAALGSPDAGAGSTGAGLLGWIGGAASSAVDAIPGIGSLSDIAGVLAMPAKVMIAAARWIADPHSWVRVLEVIGGMAALWISLELLARSGSPGSGPAGAVVGAAHKAGQAAGRGAAAAAMA